MGILDQIGKLLMRHAECVMNHIQRGDLINLDGTNSKVTTFERYYGEKEGSEQVGIWGRCPMGKVSCCFNRTAEWQVRLRFVVYLRVK